MIEHFVYRAERAAQRTALSVVGTLFILIGGAFFVVALWITLVALKDAVFAALVIGGGFFGLGLIFFGISSIMKRKRARKVPTSTLATSVVEAFVVGLSAGRAGRSGG